MTFNDHAGSTKSYQYTRKHEERANETDFVPKAEEILAQISPNGVTTVTMHDGSVVRFRAVSEGYDPTDRQKVMTYLQERQSKGEILTGLLFVDETVSDLHEMNNTPDKPLATLPYEKLCPGADALNKLQDEFH